MLSSRQSDWAGGAGKLKRPRRKCVSKYSRSSSSGGGESQAVTSSSSSSSSVSLGSLTPDCLEYICLYLDTESALALLQTCRIIHLKLRLSVSYWKHMCKLESFDEFNALKKEDDARDEERRTWCGEQFHSLNIDREKTTYWHRVFLRGTEMRRNIRRGRYELWRLYMTDKDSLPVKRMQHNTTGRELRAGHRGSKYNDQRRRVRIHRYWNEDYLVAIQHTCSHHGFNDIFVWRWAECQDPQFLYSRDLTPLYPTGLFPTAFFLWKQFLVLIPETGYINDERRLSSMIRVHDLSRDFSLAGQYDLPEGGRQRLVRPSPGSEAAHLHRLQDKAVAVCRAPTLTAFVFSLPDCRLLQTVSLPAGLEGDDMDQRFLMKDNTMFFMFHHPEFFNNLFNALEGGEPLQKRYGKLLTVNFSKYLKDETASIEMRVDHQFDTNEDYIEKISVIEQNKMACAFMSGKIAVRSILVTSDLTITYMDTLTVPCPGQLQDEHNLDYDEGDSDGPNLCTSSTGDLIIVFRHFTTGRKIHCYTSRGEVRYTLDLDEAGLQLEPRPGYVSLDLDGRFLCCADQNRIVLWESRSGRHVNTILIPDHYNYRDDPEESADRYCWKGHTDFAFTEDGIIIIHSQRNFPIAADVFLFW